jgi:nicotinamidase-related amidase
MRPALVLVDIQRDYFPGGRMEVAGAAEASTAAARLLDLFRQENLPVVHVQHIAGRPNATFLLPDTEGVGIHATVQPLPGEKIVTKHFPNSFRNTGLEALLEAQGIKELVICGMMSHMCIDATVRAAFDKGYACFLVDDACATKDLAFSGSIIPASHVHGAYMAALGAVYAKVVTLEEMMAILREIRPVRE